jgi:hypothetical protein
MKKILTGFLLICVSSALFAQTTIPPNLRSVNTLEDLSTLTTSEVLFGIPLPPKELVGDSYLNQNWKTANVLLYAKETLLKSYQVRYDLLRDEMEIKSLTTVKVIEGSKIKSFVWLDSIFQSPVYFINSSEFKTEGKAKLAGFFTVLSDGKLPLFRKTEARIVKATYNPQFNTGTRDDKVIKKNFLYYADENLVVHEVPSKLKKLLPIFGDKQEVVGQFISSGKIDTSTEAGIQQVFDYYHSLAQARKN